MTMCRRRSRSQHTRRTILTTKLTTRAGINSSSCAAHPNRSSFCPSVNTWFMIKSFVLLMMKKIRTTKKMNFMTSLLKCFAVCSCSKTCARNWSITSILAPIVLCSTSASALTAIWSVVIRTAAFVRILCLWTRSVNTFFFCHRTEHAYHRPCGETYSFRHRTHFYFDHLCV